jgi:hypothetical protein
MPDGPDLATGLSAGKTQVQNNRTEEQNTILDCLGMNADYLPLAFVSPLASIAMTAYPPRDVHDSARRRRPLWILPPFLFLPTSSILRSWSSSCEAKDTRKSRAWCKDSKHRSGLAKENLNPKNRDSKQKPDFCRPVDHRAD